MQNKCIGHCRYCGSVIEYEQEGSWIRCTSCGETLAITGFINEQIRFRQMKEKAEKTEEALKTAETEKTEAQQRLLDTLSQLETISQNQGDQRMQLDNLLTEQQYTKDEEKAIRSLLETMQGDAAENQKKMSDFLLAVMKGQQTAGEKLEALQAVSGQMIQSCGDIASLISGVEQYIRTDTEEKNRQINNLQNWAQEAREEDLNLLRNIQSDCRVLQNGLEAIDEKIARIEDSTKEVQKAVNDFHHQWEQSLRDNIINTYHQAESLQKNQSFEQAEEFYRNVLIIGGDDPEVYWRKILCHYCVEYQKNDNEDKYIPTILYPELSDPRNRSEWANLQKNLHNDEQRKYYEEQLRPIEDILRKYGQLQHQVKYDVFISVKQEENGHLTKDSDTGLLLYDKISGMGYRVFNSKRSLQAGQDFEPYIIASLLSARLMIVIGSTKEHLEAPWVKNEWTRFRWLQQKEIKQNGKTDRILVPYLTGGMKPEDLPGDLQYTQAILDGVYAGDQLNDVLKKIPASQKPIQGPGNSYNLVQNQMESWLALHDYKSVKKKYRSLVENGQYLSHASLHLYALCAVKKVPGFNELAKLKIDLKKEKLFNLAQKKVEGEEEKALICELIEANEADEDIEYYEDESIEKERDDPGQTPGEPVLQIEEKNTNSNQPALSDAVSDSGIDTEFTIEPVIRNNMITLVSNWDLGDIREQNINRLVRIMPDEKVFEPDPASAVFRFWDKNLLKDLHILTSSILLFWDDSLLGRGGGKGLLIADRGFLFRSGLGIVKYISWQEWIRQQYYIDVYSGDSLIIRQKAGRSETDLGFFLMGDKGILQMKELINHLIGVIQGEPLPEKIKKISKQQIKPDIYSGMAEVVSNWDFSDIPKNYQHLLARVTPDRLFFEPDPSSGAFHFWEKNLLKNHHIMTSNILLFWDESWLGKGGGKGLLITDSGIFFRSATGINTYLIRWQDWTRDRKYMDTDSGCSLVIRHEGNDSTIDLGSFSFMREEGILQMKDLINHLSQSICAEHVPKETEEEIKPEYRSDSKPAEPDDSTGTETEPGIVPDEISDSAESEGGSNIQKKMIELISRWNFDDIPDTNKSRLERVAPDKPVLEADPASGRIVFWAINSLEKYFIAKDAILLFWDESSKKQGKGEGFLLSERGFFLRYPKKGKTWFISWSEWSKNQYYLDSNNGCLVIRQKGTNSVKNLGNFYYLGKKGRLQMIRLINIITKVYQTETVSKE